MEIFKWKFVGGIMLLWGFFLWEFVDGGVFLWEFSCRGLLMVECYRRSTAAFILRCNVGEDNSGLV